MSWEYDPEEWAAKEMLQRQVPEQFEILLQDVRQLSLLDVDGVLGGWEELPMWFKVKHQGTVIEDFLTACYMVGEEQK